MSGAANAPITPGATEPSAAAGIARTAGPVVHHFSVDVEEYFQVNAFEPYVARERWHEMPARLEASVDAILALLDRRGATGTFFTLGWVARHRPQVVRAIAAAGHEIASHGFWHQRVVTLTPAEFRADVRDARAALEDVAGAPVTGYRAPSFSIIPGCEWAFEVLLEEGHQYDSSRFPIRRAGYGSPGTPRDPYVIDTPSGLLLELPLATATFLDRLVPAAGGGYLRQFPFGVIRRAFREAAARRAPGMFYIHPWEVDPGQPRLPVPMVTRVRHYRGLARTLPLMDRLLAEFPFRSVRETYPDGAVSLTAREPAPAAAPIPTA